MKCGKRAPHDAIKNVKEQSAYSHEQAPSDDKSLGSMAKPVYRYILGFQPSSRDLAKQTFAYLQPDTVALSQEHAE